MGVYSALVLGDKVILTDERLFLPAEWNNDKKRCQEAGVPEERFAHRDKTELAEDLVKAARSRNMRFNWVGFDALYGQDEQLLRNLDRQGEVFMADVHKDQRVYLEDPKPAIPERSSPRGRKPQKRVAQCDPVRVDWLINQQPPEAWQRINVRDGTKGDLDVDILVLRVWLWDGEEEKAHCWYLVVRREVDSPEEIKYSLSNAPEGTPVKRLAFMQAQRY